MTIVSADQMVGVLRNTVTSLVRRPGPDLTARQLCIFLICYLEPEAQTVRRLSAQMRVSKPAISRALDRLAEFDLIKRQHDEFDRRSVLVLRTVAGQEFLRVLTQIMDDAAVDVAVRAKEPRPTAVRANAA